MSSASEDEKLAAALDLLKRLPPSKVYTYLEVRLAVLLPTRRRTILTAQSFVPTPRSLARSACWSSRQT